MEIGSSTHDGASRKSSANSFPKCDLAWSLILPEFIGTFVGGLPSRCSEDQLTQFMSQFGYVKEVYISKDQSSGFHRGFAFVKFTRVTQLNRLFGKHHWMGKQIEIKRSLQEYINLSNVPRSAEESDIIDVFRNLGHKVTEVLIGGRVPGIPPGIVGVRLLKYGYQKEVAKLGSLEILGNRVKMMLHIPKTSKGEFSCSTFEYPQRPRQRSKTETHPLSILHSSQEKLWSSPTSIGPQNLSTCDVSNQTTSDQGCNVVEPRSESSPFVTDLNLNKMNSQKCKVLSSCIESSHSIRVDRISEGDSLLSEYTQQPLADAEYFIKYQEPYSLLCDKSYRRKEVMIRFYAFPGHL